LSAGGDSSIINKTLDENNDATIINDSSTQSGAKRASTNKTTIKASLREVYKQLKPPLISKRVYDELSVCIVFQILLFLANEHVSFFFSF
jgi:hypothetical protein